MIDQFDLQISYLGVFFSRKTATQAAAPLLSIAVYEQVYLGPYGPPLFFFFPIMKVMSESRESG